MGDTNLLEESKGACGFDGYLKMNGAMSTDYTKMEQAPPPPTDQVDLINEKEKESGRYLNQKQNKIENYVGFFFNYESILAKIQLNLSKRKSLKLFAQGELKVIYRKPNVGRMDTVKI
jgi:hypothetical protein